MASNKVKTRPERCSLDRRLEELEVDLRGEAQVVGYLLGLDLKGEIEKGWARENVEDIYGLVYICGRRVKRCKNQIGGLLIIKYKGNI